MTPSVTPEQENVRPPGLARWMVKHSLRTSVRDEGLLAFEDEFVKKYQKIGNLSDARSWALRVGWDNMLIAYKPLIDIGTFVLVILGLVLAVIGIL